MKKPDPTDAHVGSRIRMRRMQLGMSQTTLAGACGSISFQQVQKYENGRNRVGASRLQKIALALQVPTAFFFEGLPNGDGSPFDNSYQSAQGFLTNSHGLKIIEAWDRLTPGMQRALAAFVTTAAEAAPR